MTRFLFVITAAVAAAACAAIEGPFVSNSIEWHQAVVKRVHGDTFTDRDARTIYRGW